MRRMVTCLWLKSGGVLVCKCGDMFQFVCDGVVDVFRLLMWTVVSSKITFGCSWWG